MSKPQSDLAPITPERLITLAGEAAFERGEAYFREGRVGNLKRKGATVKAEVSGSECYSVSLRLHKNGLEGGCDCPASEGIDFCKHCVAVALAYAEESTRDAKLANGSAEERIEAHLRNLPHEQLVQQMLELILNDGALAQQWSLKADIALGKVDGKALRKRITAALPYNRQLFRYAEVRAYFNKAEPIFELLAEQVSSLPADVGLDLVDYAITRLARALQTVDDSGGFRFQVEETLKQLHKQLVGRLDWPAEKVAQYLYDIAFGETIDFYPRIPGDYADLLAPPVLEHYLRMIREQWDRLPPLEPKADWPVRYQYRRLQDVLIAHCQMNNDFCGQEALLEKTAVDPQDYLNLCSLSLQYEKLDRADHWLARAYAVSEAARHAHWKLEADRMQVRLYLAAGKSAEALALQWNVFKQEPALESYHRLLDLAGNAEERAKLAQSAKALLDSERSGSDHWLSRERTHTLMQIYLEEDELDAALKLCGEARVSVPQVVRLARRLRGEPQKCFPLYEGVIAAEVSEGNNRAYSTALALLKELAESLPAQYGPEFVRLVQRLRQEFKQKRNFIRDLNEAFPST